MYSLTLLNMIITIRFIQAADMDIKSLVLDTVRNCGLSSHFEATWYIIKVTETRYIIIAMTAIRTEQSCNTIMKRNNFINYYVHHQYNYLWSTVPVHIYVLLYWYLRQNMQHFWIFISYYYVRGSFKNCILKSIKPYHKKYNGPSCSHSITFVPRRQIWLRFFGNRIDSSCFD